MTTVDWFLVILLTVTVSVITNLMMEAYHGRRVQDDIGDYDRPPTHRRG